MAFGELVGDRAVRRLLGQQGAQRGAPADVGQAAEGAAGLGQRGRPGSCRTRRSRAPSSRSATSSAARPWCRGGRAAPVRPRRRPAGRRPASAGRCSCRTGRTGAAPGVVELAGAGTPSGTRSWPGRRASPAARGSARAATRSYRSPSYVPRLAGGHPAAAVAGHRAVHVEHLEHRLQPAPGQVDPGLDAAVDSGLPASASASSVARTCRSGGKASEAKYAQMSRSSRPGSSIDLGPLDAAPGPADLLVVGDRRLRRAQVHDEAEVGLVEPHAEGAGGDQRLDPVGEQVLLRLQPLGLVVLAAVGGDRRCPARAGTPPSRRRRRPSACR